MSNASARARTALVASRVAQASAAAAVLGIAGARVGLLTPMHGFLLFAAGAALGGPLSLVLGGIGLALSRGEHRSGRRPAGLAAGLGLGLITLVGVGAAPGGDLPRINDISTDLDDPPLFGAASREPANAGRDMAYPPAFAPQVRAAYGDLAPIRLPVAADRAFEAGLERARALGWEITWSDRDTGAFEARAVSGWFRFVDDIRVRVRAGEDGSIIDIRSKSRDGQGDLGANAARIRAFRSGLPAG